MKFYKLELINREHSYNTMFGTNPNVGIMNPLGAKVNAVNSKNLVSQKDIGAKKQRIWQNWYVPSGRDVEAYEDRARS